MLRRQKGSLTRPLLNKLIESDQKFNSKTVCQDYTQNELLISLFNVQKHNFISVLKPSHIKQPTPGFIF